MNKDTVTLPKKVIEEIELNEITDPCDPVIDSIADNHPDQYDNEDEYIQFQMDIGNWIEQNK